MPAGSVTAWPGSLPVAKVPPLLVIAVGNPSRGDDALGPLLLQRLQQWLAAGMADDAENADANDDNMGNLARSLAGRLELLEEFQLQVEHVLDLQGRQRVLVMDASVGQAAGATDAFCHCYRAVPQQDDSFFSSHALSPEALLAVWPRIAGGSPPPLEVLALQGTSFELGEPLSEQAKISLEQGWQHLLRWLQAADSCI